VKLFLILVKTCENELLIVDGWRPGSIVCDEETAYGPTFRLQGGGELTCYTSRATAERLIRVIGEPFYKTTFELVEFTRA
jgi:hypothetical protein